MRKIASKFSVWTCVVLATANFCAGAGAQTLTPTQGSVGNEQQRRQEKIEQSRQSPQIGPQDNIVVGPQAPSGAAPQSDVKFRLNGVTFDPSVFLAGPDLDASIKGFVGRDVSFSELNEITNRINAVYKSKGQVTARAIIPPQKLQNGVVHIALVEGRLGKITVTGSANTREDYIRNRIPLKAGDIIDSGRLSEDIVYFNRTGDVQVRAVMRPGSSFGETDLQLAVQEPSPDMLDLFIDNQGVESTGQVEGGIAYRHNGLVQMNDRAFLYGVISEGGITGSASYDIPIDEANTRLGVNYQRNQIEVINGPYGALGISGTGQSFGLSISRPLIATAHWLLTGVGTAAYSTSTTEDPLGSIADTNTYRGGIGGSISYIGESILIGLTPNISLVRSEDKILATTRNFALFSASGSVRARLGWNLTAKISASGQYTTERLLPADFLFQIGGPSSVRGYSAGTFAGDNGYYANFELSRESGDLFPGLEIFAFTDLGAVYSTVFSEQSLSSAGAGFVFTPQWKFVQLTGSIAVPIKDATLNQSGYKAYGQLQFHFD